jgi:hypothetical protein
MVAVLIPGRRGVRRNRERWLNVAKKQPPDDDAAGGEVMSAGAAKAVRTEGYVAHADAGVRGQETQPPGLGRTLGFKVATIVWGASNGATL